MNKKIIIAFTSVTLVSALLIGYFTLVKSKKEVQENIIYIDSFALFEQFEMKKEYDLLMEKQFSASKTRIDSIALQIREEKDQKKIENLNQRYVSEKKIFDEEFGSLSQKYTNQVYERLNEYIQRYGKSHKVDFILSSDGQGNIMYVKETKDKTKELIDFVNTEYKGK